MTTEKLTEKNNVVLLAPASEYCSEEGLLKLINHPAEAILRVSKFLIDTSEAKVIGDRDVHYCGRAYFNTKTLKFVIRWEKAEV
jgi:hypothetical protein